MHNVVNPFVVRQSAATLYFQTVFADGKVDYHNTELGRPERFISKNRDFVDGAWLVCGEDADPVALVSITLLDVPGSEVFRRELVVEFDNTADAKDWLNDVNLLDEARVHRL